LQHFDEENNQDRNISQDRTISKSTLRLLCLSPDMFSAAIKTILPTNIIVENIRIISSSDFSTTKRRSLSAFVTLARDTSTHEIDTAVSVLQNRYLSRKFNLFISRHLSSAASNLTTSSKELAFFFFISFLSFNARSIVQSNMSRSLSDDSYRDDYASSSLYTSDFARDDSQIQVSVRSSTNLKQLRLIHKTLKSLLAHDSEFETLLMSRKKMQTDEKWF